MSSVRISKPNVTLSRIQTELRDGIGKFFYDWKEGRSFQVLASVVGIAFLYGLLHALGPGHRKMVVFSLFLARPAPFWAPLAIGAFLSLLHAGISIILMIALQGITGAISGLTSSITLVMEGVAYSTLVALSLILFVRSIIALSTKKTNGDKAMGAGALLLTGIYPCPGAILILILSVSLGFFGLGILAVGAMSVGMSLPIIGAGYLAWFGRTRLVLSAKKNEKLISLLSNGAELLGYFLLFAFSLFIALPFLSSLPDFIFHLALENKPSCSYS